MANPRRRTRALRYSALRAGPSGFRKQSSGRSFRDSHGKPAPSHARAPLFWRWGLARRASRNNFPGDGQSFCDSLPRARRFRCFGAGGWPDGLPETSFRAMQSEGILGADSHGKPAPSHARAPLFRRWGLARRASRNNFPGDGRSFRDSHGKPAPSHYFGAGAGPSGFPKQFSGRRPKLLRQPPSRSLPSFWRWGLARRASRNKFPSDAKRGDLGRRQPWQTRAVARARSVISALGAGPSGFRKQSSGRSFRDSHGKPAPSLAHAPGGWPVGLPETSFRATQSGGILEAAAAYANMKSAIRNLNLKIWPRGRFLVINRPLRPLAWP